MDLWIALVVAVLALAVGVWIGIGAPGWPHQPRYHRNHDEQRGINPIQIGRSSSKEIKRPRKFGEGINGPRGRRG